MIVVPPLVEVSGLTKVYVGPDGPFDALREVSFGLAPGEIVGLLGENGSGKTTLVKTVAGIIGRDGGEVRVDGGDPAVARRATARRIGAVFPGGRNVYWRLTPSENLRYFARLRGVSLDAAALDAALAMLDLTSVRDTELRKLSTGYRQRVAVACGAVHHPRVLLLDEPTLGLDSQTTALLTQWLQRAARDQRCAVLITSHDTHFLERICDRVMVLRRGRLRFQGRVDALRDQLRDRRTYALTIASPSPALRASLAGRGGVDSTARDADLSGGRARWSFHRPDGGFLSDVVPLIGLHGAALLDVTVQQRDLGELLDDARDP